jgi:large subunit ribosomal protein L25
MVPCCLYGEKKDENGNPVATAFSVPVEGLRKLIYTPDIFVVELTIDGVATKAVMREIQFHPVKDNVLHVDFYEITEEKPIVMAVPVKLEGLATGVRAGGKLVQLQRRLKVKALYTNIPEQLVIDVTSLELGKSIKVGELSFENLQLVTPKEALVCAVKTTRASAAAAAAAAAKK